VKFKIKNFVKYLHCIALFTPLSPVMLYIVAVNIKGVFKN